MVRYWSCFVLVSALSVSAPAPADSGGTEIDLQAFDDPPPREQPSVWEGLPLQDVSQSDGPAGRRFYISGLIGPSFANFSPTNVAEPINTQDTLLAAGGAMGFALERRNGRLRIETEGMGRSTFFGPTQFFEERTVGFLTATNWSVMESVWRDVMFTDRFGAYVGGGIGAGGYR